MILFDNVLSEEGFDYRHPRKALPAEQTYASRILFAVYLIGYAVAGYLLAANILLRIA